MEELKAIEPRAMFMSRDQQWNLTTLRRYDDVETEYRRGEMLTGSHKEPEFIRFLRLLSRADSDPKALRDQFHRMKDSREGDFPRHLRELERVLGDRPAMLEVLRRELLTNGHPDIILLADALGDADLALTALRRLWNGRSEDVTDYEDLWIAPYSTLRTLPGFKELMREVGLADYWRQTGDWGDVCRPVGKDDFECK